MLCKELTVTGHHNFVLKVSKKNISSSLPRAACDETRALSDTPGCHTAGLRAANVAGARVALLRGQRQAEGGSE